MHELVGYLLLFIAVGVGFILVHLLAGKLIRPSKPDAEKLTIYECGEPTVGSAWVQFDLRYYVVALLFVIFDVEVAFFFPWAVVFGKMNDLARTEIPNTVEERRAYADKIGELLPPTVENQEHLVDFRGDFEQLTPDQQQGYQRAARSLTYLAFMDIMVFFGVLLVGFAYLWKRGDIDWVRSVAAEEPAATPSLASDSAAEMELVGAGK